jgi:hypothetical protein
MLLNYHVADFPRWSKWPVDERRSFLSLPLYDNLALENAFCHARSQGLTVVDVRIENKNFKFRIADNKLEAVDSKEQYFVCRDYGWSFTYLFDRKFEFYLCTEQFVFVTHKYKSAVVKKEKAAIEYQPIVILDGEIIFNLRDQRYNYTVYDVCCCTDSTGRTVNYCSKTMTERKKAISDYVSECHHFYNKALLPRGTQPKSLQVLPKHFYPKKDFDLVRSCITTSPTEPNKFFYKNYNLNDGLIFTPESPELYTFAPGSNDKLLKWKWPSKLTADFLLVPANNSPAPNTVFYFYFVSRSNSIFYRTMRIHSHSSEKAMSMLSNYDPSQAFIAECSFNAPTEYFEFDPYAELNDMNYVMQEPAMWGIDLIRDDKNHPNGFKVIANTLENMIEDVTEDELRVSILGESAVDSNRQVRLKQDTGFQQLFERELERTQCFAHFKLTRHHSESHKYFLSISNEAPSNNPNNPSTRTLWNYYYGVDNCLFANQDIESQIAEYAAQDPFPEVYLRCLFVPSMGKWKIKDADGEEFLSSTTHMLRVLEYNTCVNARLLKEAADNDQKRDRDNGFYHGSNGEDQTEPPNKKIRQEQ